MDDEEILRCVADALGLAESGGTVTPLSGKQGLLVCRVEIRGAPACVFKAVRESARQEVRLAAYLSGLAPDVVPCVLCAREDTKRGYYWITMRDVGPDRLGDSPSPDGYARAAAALATLQIRAMENLEEIAGLQVTRVELDDWDEMALTLLAEMETGSLRCVKDPDSLAEALWKTSSLSADAAAVPSSLVHGDLHGGNVALGERGGATILDWGSAYIGPAFLGLAELLWPLETHTGTRFDTGPIRKAYLDLWIPVLGKPGRLTSAIAACEALARLSLVKEALRRPERFGPFGASVMANGFVEACGKWERARTC